MWTDLILAHEGPSDTKYTKIAALRLKFNAFKALEGEKVQGTYTKVKILLNDLENKVVSILQAEVDAISKALISNTNLQDNDSDVEEDTRSSSEFLADLNVEFHDRALLSIPKRFYKRLYSENESLKDEISKLKKVIEKWTSSKVTLDQLLTEQVPRNIIRSLGGRGKRKDAISPREMLFTMADESPSETTPKITSDSKSECDNQDPLPPLLNFLGVEPIGTSNDEIPLADLKLTLSVPKKTKQVTKKVSSVNVAKKKTQTKSPSVLNPCPEKKANMSTE
ncbi:hypothetical protein Tco_0985202 [Tanacetum coccineum]